MRRVAVFPLIPVLLLLLVSFAFLFPVAAQEPLEPQATPDANNGLPLYAERCANCHGPSGQGDGELAANLPAPPRDYTDPAFRRGAVPALLFQTITEGRLDAGMPPFGPASTNPIAEADRWDLIAAVYSLATPQEALENGRAAYDENCLACHGESGAGDAPHGGETTVEVPDLTDLRYWSNRSNEMVLLRLQDESIADHTYELGEDSLWDVIDYARTFSFIYADPQAAVKPIESALINGHVINGTTQDLVSNGVVTLRAFTPDLQEAATFTTEVGEDGRYSFEVNDAGADWVYLSSVEYGDLSFSSNPQRLERRDPQLEMPITVFDTTTDPSAITINQVHMIMDVVNDRVQVSEIYVLSNIEPTVFVGETGNPDDGTFRLALPAGAENVQFERSFRSFDNFLPAPEVIATADGYADTTPLRPGDGAMNLVASYELPFEPGMTIAHPVFYETSSASIVVPDIGLEVAGTPWAAGGVQQMGNAGAILSYSRPALAAGEAVSFALEGRPTAAARVGGSGLALDNTTAILIGGLFLVVAAGAAMFTLRGWQRAGADAIDPQTPEIDTLLVTLADLDEAYEAGELDDETYKQRRAQLIAELAALWPKTAR